ncbi:hypothetical protein SMX63_000938 [Cronobacter universalis]|nr:hypothetical protein [Cronobacter universalis]
MAIEVLYLISTGYCLGGNGGAPHAAENVSPGGFTAVFGVSDSELTGKAVFYAVFNRRLRDAVQVFPALFIGAMNIISPP